MATASKSKEIGTLVVVVLKARNLPDRHTFTKQDPYTVVQLGPLKQQTQIDKRGGQHPIWDEDLHLKVLFPDTKANRTLKISCYAKESKEDELIGAGEVDISDTLTTGEFDDWVKLEANGAQRGEIYLEMTFFAAGPSPLARRASKLNPSERLWRPLQTSPKASAHSSPYSSPPIRHAAGLGPADAPPSRPTHLAPPRSSRSQSPTGRSEPPLPPVPEEVPATLRPAPMRASVGNTANVTPSKIEPKPVPAALRPGGPSRPTAQQQQHPRVDSVPASPTQANQQIPNVVHGQQQVYGPQTMPNGYVAPTQPAYVSPLYDEISRPSVSPAPQPMHTPPHNQYATLPPTSQAHQPNYSPSWPGSEYATHPPSSAPGQPVYSAPHPPVSPFAQPANPPSSAPNQMAYPPHQSGYSNTAYPSVGSYPNFNPSYDPPPLSPYSPTPPPATAPALPATSGGSLHLSFPEPSISPAPANYAVSHLSTYPTESGEERQRRLASRYGSPMPLPPGASPPPPPPKAQETHTVRKSPSPSPKQSPKPPAKMEPLPLSTSPAPMTEPRPAPSRVPQSYLDKERAALERRKQEEADAELARRLATEAELESSKSRATTEADEKLARRLAAEAERSGASSSRPSAPRETDEELARRLARELNSDVLEEARRHSKDGSGPMPGGW